MPRVNLGVWEGGFHLSGHGAGGFRDGADATYVVRPDMYEDESFPLLSGIDPYGETIFNQMQIPRLVRELERRLELMEAGQKRRSVERVLTLAEDSMHQTHTYLVFSGD